ncbi:MAG: hypothetical protein SGPRY_012035 [Prymnesium sp.]
MPARAVALDGLHAAVSFEEEARAALRDRAHPKSAPVLKKLLRQKTPALIQVQSREFFSVHGVVGGGPAPLRVRLALSANGRALAGRNSRNPS